MADSGSDATWYDACSPAKVHRGMRYSSFYLTMRDGVRIAVTLCLPGEGVELFTVADDPEPDTLFPIDGATSTVAGFDGRQSVTPYSVHGP